jgi:hypothetical protein
MHRWPALPAAVLAGVLTGAGDTLLVLTTNPDMGSRHTTTR